MRSLKLRLLMPSALFLAFGCNLVNNLPAGLVAGRVAELADLPEQARVAVLISVDLSELLQVCAQIKT